MDGAGAGLDFLQIEVQFLNLHPGFEFQVPLFLFDPFAFFPNPPPDLVQLDFDFGFGQYQIINPLAAPPDQLLLNGSIELFEADLNDDPRFIPIPAYRSNLAPGLGDGLRDLHFEVFGVAADGKPRLMNFNWDPGPEPEQYFLERSTDHAIWQEIAGPLLNTSYTLERLVGDPGYFFRVRIEGLLSGPVIIPVFPGAIENAQPGVPENFEVDVGLFDPITPLATIIGFLDGEDFLLINNLPPGGTWDYDDITGLVSIDIDGPGGLPPFPIIQMDPGLTSLP